MSENKTLRERFYEKFVHDGGWAIDDDGHCARPADVLSFFEAESERVMRERDQEWVEMLKRHPLVLDQLQGEIVLKGLLPNPHGNE